MVKQRGLGESNQKRSNTEGGRT